jgi:hypothetical protein
MSVFRTFQAKISDKRLRAHRVFSVAVWIIAPVLIFAVLVAVVRPRAKKDTGIYVQAPPKAILSYSEDVPLRFKANRFAEIEDTLFLPSNQQTGLRANVGYLTESEVGGVRINADESVWIVVIRKDENRWLEFYAPSHYFKTVPGTGKISFMENIKFD